MQALLQALLLQVLLREQSLPWQTQFDTMLQPSTQHFEWHFCWRASLQDNYTCVLLMRQKQRKGVDKRACTPTTTSALRFCFVELYRLCLNMYENV